MTGWDWNRESLVLELINSAKCNSLDYQFVPNDPDTQVRDLRNGNDVFGPAAVKIVKPGVIGRLLFALGGPRTLGRNFFLNAPFRLFFLYFLLFYKQ